MPSYIILLCLHEDYKAVSGNNHSSRELCHTSLFVVSAEQTRDGYVNTAVTLSNPEMRRVRSGEVIYDYDFYRG